MAQEYDRASQGGAGFKNVSGTTLVGDFVYLVCDTDATFSAVCNIPGSDNVLSTARSEGVVVAGKFSSVTVTAGRVRAYLNAKV